MSAVHPGHFARPNTGCDQANLQEVIETVYLPYEYQFLLYPLPTNLIS